MRSTSVTCAAKLRSIRIFKLVIKDATVTFLKSMIMTELNSNLIDFSFIFHNTTDISFPVDNGTILGCTKIGMCVSSFFFDGTLAGAL